MLEDCLRMLMSKASVMLFRKGNGWEAKYELRRPIWTKEYRQTMRHFFLLRNEKFSKN